MVEINYMISKKKIIFLKILIMNKTLLLLIFTPIFLFSQIDDFQGFMDFTYNNDSGKIILNIEHKNIEPHFKPQTFNIQKIFN